MSPLDVAILALATWRLAHLFAFEDGPFHIFYRLRKAAGQRLNADGIPYNTTHLAEGLACLWCNSVWFGVLLTVMFAICGRIALMVALPLALSCIAVAIDTSIEAVSRGIQEWQ